MSRKGGGQKNAAADDTIADILHNEFEGVGYGFGIEEWVKNHPALQSNDDVRQFDTALRDFLVHLKGREYGTVSAFTFLVAQAREVKVRHLQV